MVPKVSGLSVIDMCADPVFSFVLYKMVERPSKCVSVQKLVNVTWKSSLREVLSKSEQSDSVTLSEAYSMWVKFFCGFPNFAERQRPPPKFSGFCCWSSWNESSWQPCPYPPPNPIHPCPLDINNHKGNKPEFRHMRLRKLVLQGQNKNN